MNTYEAWVKVPLNSTGTSLLPTKVRVQAMDIHAAQGQLIALYGATNIIHPPLPVR